MRTLRTTLSSRAAQTARDPLRMCEDRRFQEADSALSLQLGMTGRLRREGLASSAWTKSFLNRLRGSVKRDAIFLADAFRVFARREADDIRRLRSDVAHAVARERVERVDVDPFAPQQIAFGRTAERVVADAAGRRHDAVTRHDVRHDVARAEIRDGADGARTSDLCGEPCVR